MTARFAKTFFVAAVSAFALLVALNNVVDYGSNFQFVTHVMSMDTTFEGNRLMGRAIASPSAHHVAYWVIIATEAAVGAACGWGAWSLWKARRRSTLEFAAAMRPATFGLTLGIALWFGGFLTVGAEWFVMWQSDDWNGQDAAFRFTMVLFATLIFLHLPEDASFRGTRGAN